MAAIAALLRLKGNLGEALPGLPRHDFVGAFRHLVQAGRAAIKPQTDRIQDGRLSRACGAGNGENAVRRIGRMSEIDLPFTRQRINIFKPDSQYPHVFLLLLFILQ